MKSSNRKDYLSAQRMTRTSDASPHSKMSERCQRTVFAGKCKGIGRGLLRGLGPWLAVKSWTRDPGSCHGGGAKAQGPRPIESPPCFQRRGSSQPVSCWDQARPQGQRQQLTARAKLCRRAAGSVHTFLSNSLYTVSSNTSRSPCRYTLSSRPVWVSSQVALCTRSEASRSTFKHAPHASQPTGGLPARWI